MKQPIDVWLQNGSRRKVEIESTGFKTMAVLLDERNEVVGCGRGATVDDAIADALNDIERRRR